MCNMKGSWIKIYRKCEDNSLYFSEPFTKWQAWQDLLLKANYKDSHYFSGGQQINVQRGQVGISILTMSKRWKWSRKKVGNFLNYLEKEHQIAQQRNNKTTLVSILNYNLYQSEDSEKEHQKDIRSTSEEHIQESKELKELKEIEKERDMPEENSISIGKMVFDFKNEESDTVKFIDPFENPEKHNPAGIGVSVLNDIFNNKWPRDKRGNYKEAQEAFYRYYDLSEGFEDLYAAIDEYQKSKNFKDGIIMKVSTFLAEWDNYKPSNKQKIKDHEKCEICNQDGYLEIDAPYKQGSYNSNTGTYYYPVDCKCVSNKDKFESLIGVSEDLFLSAESKITEEYKENIKRRLVISN